MNNEKLKNNSTIRTITIEPTLAKQLKPQEDLRIILGSSVHFPWKLGNLLSDITQVEFVFMTTFRYKFRSFV